MNTDNRGFLNRVFLTVLQSVFIGVHLWFPNCSAEAQSFLWWEAEDTQRTDVPERSPFRPGTGGDFSVLSGGDWLSGTVKPGGPPVAAHYTLTIPADGNYTLWARKFWKHGPFRWRFGDADWRTAGRDLTLADSASIRQHLVANWVALGEVELTKGETTFTWQLTDLRPGKEEAYGLDCFLLTQAPFTPRGKLKPDTRDSRAMPGHFAWDPPTDPFPPYPQEAGFDHRHLNETFAGVNGRIGKTDDGNGFVLGDGTPVKFWGVNLKPEHGGAPQDLVDYYARRMAKLGVNLVRLHGPLWSPGAPGSDDADGRWRVSPEKLDQLHRLVAALKEQGIYTVVSFYFPVWIDAKQAGLPGYEDFRGRHPFATHMFDPGIQQFYFDTMRDIFSPVNPHTGLSLAEDPAVAMVELINEDSFFFWTFKPENVPPKLWEGLQNQYENSPHYAGGELEGVWRLTRAGMKDASRRQQKRARAQAAFLADLQRGFYEQAIAELRALGYDGLTVCSNWHTADPPMLDALERWTYTAGDVIDHHGYFEAPHDGEGSSYSVRVGHTFESRSALQHLDELPLRVNQVRGHPQMISEVNWPLPNEHRADMVWLGVAALSVQGVDAVCWFQNTTLTGVETDWTQKFTIDVPSITGQFPAAALAFRRGDIPEQEPVVVESLRSQDLKALSGSATANHASLEQFRARDVEQPVEAFDAVDPLVYYVGPVVRVYDDAQADSIQEVISIPSLTEERGQGRSPDWLQPGPASSMGVDITRPTLVASVGLDRGGDYMGTYAFVSLDGLPFAESRQILVVFLRGEAPYGFRDRAGRIESLGSAPLNLIERGMGGPGFPWRVADRAVYRATRLDENGNRREGEVSLKQTMFGDRAGWFFAWPASTIYVLLERIDGADRDEPRP